MAQSTRLLSAFAIAALGPLWAQPAAEQPVPVTGVLVDERGHPLAEVDVVLRPYPSKYALTLDHLGQPNALPQTAGRIRTGPDGAFSLFAPTIGPFRLEIQAPLSTLADGVTVPRQHLDIVPLKIPLNLNRITVRDLRPLTVDVRDPEGRPITGAFVFVDSSSSRSEHPNLEPEQELNRFALATGGVSAQTDPEGQARFLIPLAAPRVTVLALGFAAEAVNALAGRATLRLAPAPAVTVSVKDSNGRPLERVALRLGGRRPVPLGLTNEEGAAEIAIVAATRQTLLEVETASSGFARARLPSEATRADAAQTPRVEIVLPPNVALPGRVTDSETGFPVPGAVVWARSDPGRVAVSDGRGAFDLAAPLLLAGDVEIGVVADGYVSGVANFPKDFSHTSRRLAIGLEAARSISGRVVNSREHAVAGASIYIEPRHERFYTTGRERSRRVTTGADGSFRIDNALYGRAYRLTAEGAAFPPVRLELPKLERGTPTSPLHIVLEEGRLAWGTTIGQHGEAVSGAEVRLVWPQDSPELGNGDQSRALGKAAVSDDRGVFEFPPLAPGLYGVEASHPDYIDLPAQIIGVPEGDGYFDLGLFALAPGSEVRGVVVNERERPVQGAEVWARQRTRGLATQERVATTDEHGHFRLGGLLQTPTDVTATADGYAPASVQSVRPATGESIVIELAQGASLAGRVLEADGTPADDVEVTLALPVVEVPRTAREPFGQDLFHVGRTTRDGRFHFRNVVPAKWTAEARTRTSLATQRGIELSHGQLREIELRLEVPDRLVVLVENHIGEPVADARVRAQPRDHARVAVSDETDASGRAVLWVTPGPGTLAVEHPDLLDHSRQVVVAPGTNELHVQLEAGWEIIGTVETVDGTPIPAATVEARRELVGDGSESEQAILLRRYRGILAPSTHGLSDVSGSFRLAGLAPGRYRIVARLAGQTEGESAQTVEIHDQSVAGVELVLEQGTSLRGFITGLDGLDLVLAEVQAWKGVLFRTANPDDSGNFELNALGPGTWRISAISGGRRSQLQTVKLEPGGSTTLVEVPFELGLRLSGQVLLGGTPTEGVLVSAWPVPPVEGGQLRRTRSDHRGYFEIEELQAGSYQIQFWHVHGQPMAQQVELQSDYPNVRIDLQPRSATVAH